MSILILEHLSEEDEDLLISNVPCIMFKPGCFAVPPDCFAELRRLNLPYRVEPI